MLENIKNRFKSNFILIVALFIMVWSMGIMMNYIIEKCYEYENYFNVLTEGSGRTPVVSSGVVISQKFVAQNNNLNRIGIFSLRPSISTNSTVNVRIIDLKDNQEIINNDVFLGGLEPDSYFEIFLENQANSKNREYQIIITGIDGDELNSVQFPYSSSVNKRLNDCTANGEKQENNLIVKNTYNLMFGKFKQVIFYTLVYIILVTTVLFFDLQKELFKYLVFDKNTVLKNLKYNCVFIIPFIAFYMISIRDSMLEYLFSAVSLIVFICILSQFESILKKIREMNIFVKIYSLISSLGIVTYRSKLFVKNYTGSKLYYIFKNANIMIEPQIYSIICAIVSFILVFAVVAIFINFIKNKCKELFSDFTKKDYIFYGTIFIVLLVFVIFIFVNTTVSYGTGGAIFDVLFTSDSGRLVIDESAYLSLYHGENDLRQPLFALFAMPFVGFGYTISLINQNIVWLMPLCENIIQLAMFFIANFMIAKLLGMNKLEEKLFMVVSLVTYMSLLFTIMMEQYLVAYFWLILSIYSICTNKQDEVVLSGAGGTLLTSLVLVPFINKEFKINDYKNIIINMIKVGIVFVCLLVLINRIDLLENLFYKSEQYNTFVDDNTSVLFKLKEYTTFVKNCFVYPQTEETSTIVCAHSLRTVSAEMVSVVGIIIMVLSIIGFVLNRKDKFTQISFVWFLFATVLLGIVGWGTAENGLILYSLYFGWSYLVLVTKFMQSISKKYKYMLSIIFIIAIIALCGCNYFGLKNIFDFAFKYYKI